jgi:hypothetical protein
MSSITNRLGQIKAKLHALTSSLGFLKLKPKLNISFKQGWVISQMHLFMYWKHGQMRLNESGLKGGKKVAGVAPRQVI